MHLVDLLPLLLYIVIVNEASASILTINIIAKGLGNDVQVGATSGVQLHCCCPYVLQPSIASTKVVYVRHVITVIGPTAWKGDRA